MDERSGLFYRDVRHKTRAGTRQGRLQRHLGEIALPTTFLSGNLSLRRVLQNAQMTDHATWEKIRDTYDMGILHYAVPTLLDQGWLTHAEATQICEIALRHTEHKIEHACKTAI